MTSAACCVSEVEFLAVGVGEVGVGEVSVGEVVSASLTK